MECLSYERVFRKYDPLLKTHILYIIALRQCSLKVARYLQIDHDTEKNVLISGVISFQWSRCCIPWKWKSELCGILCTLRIRLYVSQLLRAICLIEHAGTPHRNGIETANSFDTWNTSKSESKKYVANREKFFIEEISRNWCEVCYGMGLFVTFAFFVSRKETSRIRENSHKYFSRKSSLAKTSVIFSQNFLRLIHVINVYCALKWIELAVEMFFDLPFFWNNAYLQVLILSRWLKHYCWSWSVINFEVCIFNFFLLFKYNF